MIRFLTFLAFLAVGYSIYRISQEEAGADVPEVHGSADGEGPGLASAKGGIISSSLRPRVFLFTGPDWCPPCRTLDQKVILTSTWRSFAAKEVNFERIEVPRDSGKLGDADRTLLVVHGIRSFPTMVVIDPKGRELQRRSGGSDSPEEVIAWVRRAATGS